MREIKFRAWDGREMHHELTHMLAPNGRAYPTLPLGAGLPKEIRVKNSADLHVVIQQFTGLHDKNGMKIYEGDVLRIFDENYEVKFVVNDSKCFVDYGYPNIHNGPAPHWVEVIGNIYDNPELLPSSDPEHLKVDKPTHHDNA
ncbi:MAG: YopX family protein [Vicinamibacterales bacterium]|nr:YopX family protein [Vicinamibacterales bacterium]